MFDDLIFFKEDVAKKYCERRQNIKPKEVEDILNCLARFLKYSTREDKHYAYVFPKLGTMYKGFFEEYNQLLDKKDSNRLNQQWLDITINSKSKLKKETLLESRFPDKTLEELQKWQNESY